MPGFGLEHPFRLAAAAVAAGCLLVLVFRGRTARAARLPRALYLLALAAVVLTFGEPYYLSRSGPPVVVELLDVSASVPSPADFHRRAALLAESNIAAARIAGFSVMEMDEAGNLARIIEKPPPELVASMPEPILVSMNCWRFQPAIFDACRSIERSSRGEYELQDAIQMLLAGATLVGLGTAVYSREMEVFTEINRGITAYLKEKGYASIREIVGRAHE